jgi:hypothetical protein
MCSHRLIATTIANPPKLDFGQEVLHGDLQRLHYDLVDLHKLTPNLQEVWKSVFLAPLKQILLDLNNFFRFVDL